MPIYEFKCPKCENVFEEIRPMSASSDPKDCENGCKEGESVVKCTKIISSTAIPQTGDPERQDRLIKDRNNEYWKKGGGKDELHHNKEKLAKKYGVL